MRNVLMAMVITLGMIVLACAIAGVIVWITVLGVTAVIPMWTSISILFTMGFIILSVIVYKSYL